MKYLSSPGEMLCFRDGFKITQLVKFQRKHPHILISYYTGIERKRKAS